MKFKRFLNHFCTRFLSKSSFIAHRVRRMFCPWSAGKSFLSYPRIYFSHGFSSQRSGQAMQRDHLVLRYMYSQSRYIDTLSSIS